MRLAEGQKGKTYTVKAITAEEGLQRRLRMIGMTDGSAVSVLGKRRGGNMIVKIRGTRFALGSAITNSIGVGGEVKCKKL